MLELALISLLEKPIVMLRRSAMHKENYLNFYCKSNQIQGNITEEDGLIKLHIDGVFAHAAMTWNGVNAALHLLNFVGSAYDDQLAKDL